MRRSLLASVIACVALAAGFALPAGAGAAELGVNAVNLSPQQSLDLSSQAGAKWVRLFVRWDQVEPDGPGRWDAAAVATLDQVVAGATAHGQKVVAVVLGTPFWANFSPDRMVPPITPGDYGRFLGAFAARYKGRVAAWEIWNEPDENQFWHGTPGPAAYAPLLIAAHRAIHEADPASLVLAAASTGNDYPYLEGLYTAGAGGSFDGVAVHTDTACNITSPDSYYRENGRVGRFSFLGLREVHATLEAHGDGALPIIMSEIGWSANSARCARGVWAGKKAAGVTEAQQAAYLRLAYRCLADYPYVKAALWFSMRDGGPDEAELSRFGLVRWDGSHRPAFDAFQQIARNGPPTGGSCGDFTPPSVRVHAPTAGAMYDRYVSLKVSAADGQSKLARITLYGNGVKVRSWGSLRNNVPITGRWFGAHALPLGNVTLTFEAVDEFGNVGRQNVVVRRVEPATLPPIATTLALKLSGQGLTRTVKGRVLAPGAAFKTTGRVLVAWQMNRGGHWVTMHRLSKSAARTFTYRQRLRGAGRWRVVATYAGSRPFRPARSAALRFSAH